MITQHRKLAVDRALFRKAMGRFPTGVTVITGHDGAGAPVGVTVSAFSSLSLDPPLILFCLTAGTATMAAFQPEKTFAVNILAMDQGALSDQFAGPPEARFSGVEHHPGESGAPLLAGAVASVECRVDQTFSGGDHQIIIGRVERVTVAEGKIPLVYCQSAYHELGSPLAG